MDELNKYYQVLGLLPGASLEEVNQAYKDLAFIWHPDRIPTDNPRLQQKAQDKLKEINHARDQLRSMGKNAPSPKAPPRSSSQPPRSYYKQEPSTPYQSPKAPPRSSSQPPRSYYKQEPPTASQSQEKKPYSDLSGTNWSGADLKEKDFSGRNLSDANLSHANLSDAFLHKVNLQGANLYKANLFRANLLQANLRNACLREANLIGADLSGADLSGADLTGAKIGFNDKIMVKLTGAILAGAIFPDGTIYPS
jgi:curved DNA-binding protein CbpA